MDDSFDEMEQLLQKAQYVMSVSKKYVGAEVIVDEADELMKQWGKAAKKYVAASREYHNLVYKNTPI